MTVIHRCTAQPKVLMALFLFGAGVRNNVIDMDSVFGI
jgi:hypothetical protein